jgi:hypothetical protein
MPRTDFPEPLSSPFRVMLPLRLHAELRDHALRHDRSMATTARRAIEALIERERHTEADAE